MNSTTCHTCELTARRDQGKAPVWDCIHRTQYWDIVHSYNTALRGWLVLVSRRHITAVDEMTESEAVELGKLIRQVSIALKDVTGCAKTYVIQFAEAAEHPHVHFHVVPRMADQPENRKGPNIFGYLNITDDLRLGEDAMNEIAVEIRHILLKSRE